MLPPNFYNQGDQAIYSAGDFFIPQERFRAAPYTVNKPNNPDDVPAGIPAIYQSQGGGGGYTGGISDLTTNFFDTTANRQNRLTELNRPLAEAQFPSFPGAKTPGGLNAQQMYNIASEDLNDPFNRSAMSTTFPTRTAKEVMDYADDAIQDYRMQYATGELGPSFIEAEKPTLNRRINDFVYDKLGFTRPQSADQIIADGYTGQSNMPGILGMMLGKVDKYGSLPRGDQAFIARNMGYTGPTVFGANDSGLSKDVFGMNTRSGFGNYAEAVGEQVDKLGESLSATGAIGSKDAYQGASFNEATGMFEADDDDEASIAAANKANQMTKMVRAKYNFYQKQVAQRDADRAAAQAKVEAQERAKAARDNAGTQRRSDGSGGGNLTRSRDQGGLGLSASQAQSVSAANAAAGMGGWGLADGGRVPYMNGGLADMLEIYD